MKCLIPECQREGKSRGLCDKHYQWAMRRGVLDDFVGIHMKTNRRYIVGRRLKDGTYFFLSDSHPTIGQAKEAAKKEKIENPIIAELTDSTNLE